LYVVGELTAGWRALDAVLTGPDVATGNLMDALYVLVTLVLLYLSFWMIRLFSRM
jgi:hypothetical protein